MTENGMLHPERSAIHGIMAEFDSPDRLRIAAEHAVKQGYRRFEAYSPFPVEGISELMDFHTKLPLGVLVMGLIGAASGFGMEYFAAVINYPIHIGGRPLNSWPMFIPITFELAVLFAGLTAVIYMLAANNLPQPYHPVFNVKRFEHASDDGFFLVIESMDPKFDRMQTRQFLEGLKPDGVWVVEN